MNDLRPRALWIGAALPPQEAVEEAGYALCGHARDAFEGLRLLRLLQPELALADAILPGADGVAFAQEFSNLPLYVRPPLLLLLLPGAPLIERELLPDLGAAVIEKPATAQSILGAVAALQAKGPVLPPRKAIKLDVLLDALGVPAHPGRDCLRAAVRIVWADRFKMRGMARTLYPQAGAACGLTGAQAERAIRHVIDVAFRTGDMVQQQKIFGDTIDARRGRPTCGEMIAQLADILRWEG